MHDEEPQQPQPIPPPIPAPVPEGPGEDFFKFRIDGKDILEDMEHQLKGEIYDDAQGMYVQKFDRWINDKGVNKILHVTYSLGINKNTFLGNLTKEQIDYKCMMLKKNLALLLFKKYHDYGVKKEMRNLLITTVMNTVHSGLSRSEGGKEADQISTAAQRYEMFHHQEQPQQQRPGLFSGKIPFFGKRGY